MANSLLTDLENLGQKFETFLDNVINGEKKVAIALAAVSGPTKAVVLAIVNDAVKVVSETAATVGAAETGNIPAVITLSSTTFAGVHQLVTDAKAGVAQAVADLAALGIKL